MKKRNSILFKLDILFILAMLASIVAGVLVWVHLHKQMRSDLLFKGRLAIRELRKKGDLRGDFLNMLKLREIDGENRREILLNSKRKSSRRALAKRQKRRTRPVFVQYRGKEYIVIVARGKRWVLAPENGYVHYFGVPILVFVGLIVLLTVIYWLIRRSLAPLRRLERDIRRYGNGEMPETVTMNGGDEISCLNNAFYSSVQRIKRLDESRKLFLRNIFHELNTPVTKGKLLTEITDEPQTKRMLESIFGRMSVLLDELAQIERIASAEYRLKPTKIRTVELIDHARDLLYIDEPIAGNVSDQSIFADFSSMGIVFKNLIDNAMKYGGDLVIDQSSTEISFSSTGDALKYPLSHYTDAFRKGDGFGSTRGFGLGLYIVKEILQKHGMELSYRHSESRNIFSIVLNP